MIISRRRPHEQPTGDKPESAALAMYVVGPLFAGVFVAGAPSSSSSGFLDLAQLGAPSTRRIVGLEWRCSNRVAEDGVLPDFLPSPASRATGRAIASSIWSSACRSSPSWRGARATSTRSARRMPSGVVWSFVFKAASMVVLRFKDRNPAGVARAVSTSGSRGRRAADRTLAHLPRAGWRRRSSTSRPRKVATVWGPNRVHAGVLSPSSRPSERPFSANDRTGLHLEKFQRPLHPPTSIWLGLGLKRTAAAVLVPVRESGANLEATSTAPPRATAGRSGLRRQSS